MILKVTIFSTMKEKGPQQQKITVFLYDNLHAPQVIFQGRWSVKKGLSPILCACSALTPQHEKQSHVVYLEGRFHMESWHKNSQSEMWTSRVIHGGNMLAQERRQATAGTYPQKCGNPIWWVSRTPREVILALWAWVTSVPAKVFYLSGGLFHEDVDQ